MPIQPHTPSDPVRPSDYVRIEAAALNELAQRLDTTMLAPFTQASDLFFDLRRKADPHHRHRHRQERHHRAQDRRHASLHRHAGTLPSRGRGNPRRPWHARAPATLSRPLDSGETEELLRLLPTLKRLDAKLIAISGCRTSTLAQASDIFLDTGVSAEACPLNLAPTASTTAMLALGDALALEVSRRRGWKAEDFADLHPGGRIGRRLARVRELMHSGDALPQVSPSTPMAQVIHEMSRKKLGMTTVLEHGRLTGMISDGDLRRLLERDGSHALDRTAGEI